VRKDGLPNSLTHVKVIVVHSLITCLFDFLNYIQNNTKGYCISYRTVMLYLLVTEIIYSKVGDGNVQTSTQSG